MKKYISSVITLCLFLGLLSPLCGASAPDALRLAELAPTRATGYVDPQLNVTGVVNGVDGVDIRYPNSVIVHPKSTTEPSYVDYDISGYSYQYFFAYLGKNASVAAVGRGVQFIVRADGAAIYESEIIRVGGAPVLCTAEIPAGTKLLTLEVNCGNDGVDYDTSVWGTPTLSDKTVVSISEARHPNTVRYDKGAELLLKGAYAAVAYSNGFTENVPLEPSMVSGFDGEKEGVQTLTVSYEGFSYTFEVTIGEVQTAGETTAPATEEPTGELTGEPDATSPQSDAAESEAPISSRGGNTALIVVCAVIIIAAAAAITAAVIKLKKK